MNLLVGSSLTTLTVMSALTTALQDTLNTFQSWTACLRSTLKTQPRSSSSRPKNQPRSSSSRPQPPRSEVPGEINTQNCIRQGPLGVATPTDRASVRRLRRNCIPGRVLQRPLDVRSQATSSPVRGPRGVAAPTDGTTVASLQHRKRNRVPGNVISQRVQMKIILVLDVEARNASLQVLDAEVGDASFRF